MAAARWPAILIWRRARSWLTRTGAAGTTFRTRAPCPVLSSGTATTGNTPNWAGSNINIGANTPWMGVSTDRGGRRIFSGDIVIDDGSNGGTQPATLTSVTLQGVNLATLTLGNDAL